MGGKEGKKEMSSARWAAIFQKRPESEDVRSEGPGVLLTRAQLGPWHITAKGSK